LIGTNERTERTTVGKRYSLKDSSCHRRMSAIKDAKTIKRKAKAFEIALEKLLSSGEQRQRETYFSS